MPKESRFASVDFSTADVIPWTPELAGALGPGFRCNRHEFTSIWKKQIHRECSAHIARCWIIHHSGYLAGYITLIADKLSVRRKILISEDIERRTFPAVKIGVLAADRRAKGAGTCLMEWAIWYVANNLSLAVGVRFITVDALYDSDTGYDVSGYYHNKFGFQFHRPPGRPPKRRTHREMFLDLKPLIDMIQEASV